MRTRSVMEGDVKELDIQRLPTTPLFPSLALFSMYSSSASMHRVALLPFAAASQEAPSAAIIVTGLTTHKQAV